MNEVIPPFDADLFQQASKGWSKDVVGEAEKILRNHIAEQDRASRFGPKRHDLCYALIRTAGLESTLPEPQLSGAAQTLVVAYYDLLDETALGSVQVQPTANF